MNETHCRFLLLFALLVLSILPVIPTPAVNAQSPPDIVVLMTDDMRADDWPVLEQTQRLVAGTWFPNFIYPTPLCCPARASFQTGMLAHNSGVRQDGDGPKFRALETDTLATALDAVGYHTAYVGKFLNGYKVQPPGWDSWQGSANSTDYWVKGEYVTDAWRDLAIDAIAAAPSYDPLFLMVGFRAPHNPATPAKRHTNADVGAAGGLEAKRKRSLLAVDEAVVAIAEAMGPRWDAACVFVLTDNGYLLGEHGTSGKSIWWDEAVRIPLLARCNGLGPGSDERLASLVDVPATILAAAGAEMGHTLDGRPLQNQWNREGVLIESRARSSAGHKRAPFTAIKGDGWLYLEVNGEQPRYFLRADGEATDHIAELSVGERERLAAWLAALRDCIGADCG